MAFFIAADQVIPDHFHPLFPSSRRLAARVLSFAFFGLVAPEARAEVEVLSGPNFFVLYGASGVDGCLPRDTAKRVLRDRVLAANDAAGVDPKLGVVLSLEVPPCADLFFSPVANDIEGIGYQHLYDEELFDESPDSALEGVAFLNDVPYWEFYPEELRRAFLHEVGHRWGVRVHVAGDDPTALLGRDNEHWSYFLDTSSDRGVSPLEGNAWAGAAPELSTATADAASGYSDLDLYLMGLIAPDDVAPVRLLIPEEGQELPVDCMGTELGPGSPPQRCEEVQLRVTEQVFSISDVIEVEGARIPAVSEEPVVTDVGFYFLSTEGVWTVEDCEHWEAEVAGLLQTFSDATGERMTLSNVVRAGATCDKVVSALDSRRPEPESEAPRSSSGCSTSPHHAPNPGIVLVLGALLVGLRRRHKKIPG